MVVSSGTVGLSRSTGEALDDRTRDSQTYSRPVRSGTMRHIHERVKLDCRPVEIIRVSPLWCDDHPLGGSRCRLARPGRAQTSNRTEVCLPDLRHRCLQKFPRHTMGWTLVSPTSRGVPERIKKRIGRRPSKKKSQGIREKNQFVSRLLSRPNSFSLHRSFLGLA